jgi:hypothetical protein
MMPFLNVPFTGDNEVMAARPISVKSAEHFEINQKRRFEQWSCIARECARRQRFVTVSLRSCIALTGPRRTPDVPSLRRLADAGSHTDPNCERLSGVEAGGGAAA